MSIDEDDIDFDDLDEGTDELRSLIDEIKKRCDECGISYEDSSFPNEFDVDLRINFPNGRENRIVWLFDHDDLLKFNSIRFEDYSLIGPYAAILNPEENEIEAIVTAPQLPKYSYNRIKKTLGADSKRDLILTSEVEENTLQITIGTISEEVKAISGINDGLGLSLRIVGPGLDTHDKALKKLRDITNSLFFDIDIQKGILLSLIRTNPKKRRSQLKDDGIPIEYPKNAYDSAPMDLYWYARSAVNMPLLQFLAYYQSIEFYYPSFFNAELSKKIRGILKNPSFRVGNDSDITKIVSTIKVNSTGFASEKEQLKTTIKECITNDEILEFLNSTKERAEFFNSKAKGITAKTINQQNKNHELYAQLADRIYDIRCKIVHTKGEEAEGEIELLLPYSQEAEKLYDDIELVRFVAQKIIVCASKDSLS